MRDSPEKGEPSRIDLGKIDFDALKRFFDKSKHKAASTEALIVATRDQGARLVHLNRTRVSLRERFEGMIAEFNTGALNVADFFRELTAFLKKVEAEEARASTEGLTVEQLPVYDLLLAKGGKPSAKASSKAAVAEAAVVSLVASLVRPPPASSPLVAALANAQGRHPSIIARTRCSAPRCELLGRLAPTRCARRAPPTPSAKPE